jgi:hypothetical protein
MNYYRKQKENSETSENSDVWAVVGIILLTVLIGWLSGGLNRPDL